MSADLSAKLPISEIFASVQGEGIWSGVPSSFVRVSGCNLRCSWCDTPYASWHPESTPRTLDEVWSEVQGHDLRHLVITGGEPLLFPGTAELARLAHEAGIKVTFETAGTLDTQAPCDLMSISPKLAHSTPDDPVWRDRHERTRINLEVLRSLISRYPHQLKFVVNPDQPGAFREIEQLLEHLPPVDPNHVLLMAEGTDAESVLRRTRALVKPAMERNWRLTTRLHIDLFGNTKGT